MGRWRNTAVFQGISEEVTQLGNVRGPVGGPLKYQNVLVSVVYVISMISLYYVFGIGYMSVRIKVLGKVQTDLCFEKSKFHLKI